MKRYFISYEEFKARGGSIKSSTITYDELQAVLTMHMERLDKQFTLHINGHTPKPVHELIEEAFELCHLHKPFYTQHCANRSYRYRSTSKNRVKVEFTLSYRMNGDQEQWMLTEIEHTLKTITKPSMTTLQKVVAVHDYIVRTYAYEMQTKGSPFAVHTFMQEKRGVCMAYALLFEKMMEMLAIPCYYVIGKADGEGDAGHAWNLVNIDGEWFHIDVTWDDIGHVYENHVIRYRYFLCTDEQMAINHQWDLDLYPPCTSKRFNVFHALYDACIVEDTLIYPHPKTALLTELRLNKLQTKRLLNIRVQSCTYANDRIYFSNYSHLGYLYTFNLRTNELKHVRAESVHHINTMSDQLIVTYKNQTTETFALEKSHSANIKENAFIVENTIQHTSALMMSFGESWLATFEATDPTFVAFKSAEGIEFILAEPVKQLTISLEMEKGIQLQVTSNRKPLTFKQPAQLKIPMHLVQHLLGSLQKKLSNKLSMVDDNVYITIQRSITL